jgi:cytochrome c oxidase subunit 2
LSSGLVLIGEKPVALGAVPKDGRCAGPSGSKLLEGEDGRDMAVAVVLVLVAVGSVVFHLLSPWWWTPIASNWRYIDETIVITFWITGVVFVAVVLFMAYCVFPLPPPERAGRAAYEPENKKLEWWLTVATAVGVAAMLAPGLFVWSQFVTSRTTRPRSRSSARQWQWSYRLPGKDGKLGTSDIRHIGPDNPLGLNPHDADGQDDVVIEAEDLHLPIGKPGQGAAPLHRRPARLLRARVPREDGHGPGLGHLFLVHPTRTGTFDVLCAELCGVGHAVMRGRVVVESEADHAAWLSGRRTFAQLAGQAR